MEVKRMKCPHCGEMISQKLIMKHTGEMLGKSNKGKTSPQKKQASRLNGKLGGRPRKKTK